MKVANEAREKAEREQKQSLSVIAVRHLSPPCRLLPLPHLDTRNSDNHLLLSYLK